MILMSIIRAIIKWVREHLRVVLAGSAVFGGAAAGVGAYNAHKAKKINKEAIEIKNAALEKHDRAYVETQQVLSELGKVEERAINSFEWFADTMERIQGRPQFKASVFSSVKLPNYEPAEIKSLSAGVRMVIGGVGGAGVGALAGLAAFGAGAIIAAPAMIGAGLVLCVKGFGLKKKAIENKRQAKEMMKSVNEIVEFYAELRKAADTYRESINAVYYKYTEYLTRVETILLTKCLWKEFTRKEKRTVEDTVLLARLLYEMSKVSLVVKQDDEGKLETINYAELAKLQKQAGKMLKDVA